MIKANSEVFGLKALVIWLGVVTLFFVAVIGGFWWINIRIPKKIHDESQSNSQKLPAPISTEKGEALAKSLVRGITYADYLNRPEFQSSESIGEPGSENLIYTYIGKGAFKNGKGVKDEYAILINSHYPERYAVLVNKTKAEISAAKNKLSLSPKEAPNKRVIENEDVLSGRKQTIVETTHQKDSKEAEKPKEDLQ